VPPFVRRVPLDGVFGLTVRHVDLRRPHVAIASFQPRAYAFFSEG
jgi:hypothetical protein